MKAEGRMKLNALLLHSSFCLLPLAKVHMRITVLRGGPSSEREVSLVSGRSVADALRASGHLVFESDIDPDHLEGLDEPCDVVFPVLHGAFGESGELQEILERRGLPFVGSGAAASRLGMNKQDAKKVWQQAGLPTPRGLLLTPTNFDSAELFAPSVAKPVDGGSSIDVEMCRTSEAAKTACNRLIAKYGQVLLEEFIDGTEITVGILDERPLDPIRISTTHAFYDFAAKYSGTESAHHFDLNLPEAVVEDLKEIARRAHEVIGCRDLSRLDFIVDRQNKPFLLEINTMPGFTPTSLLPDAANHGGITLPQLVDRLVQRAAGRSASRVSLQISRRVALGSNIPSVEAAV